MKADRYHLPAVLITHNISSTELANTLGVHRRQIHRWIVEGMTWEQADRVAVALGYHPSELWTNWIPTEATR